MRNSDYALLLSMALLVTGCGAPTGPDPDGTLPDEAAPTRTNSDPTLRGLIARFEQIGIKVGPKRSMAATQSRNAAIGRAAALANELAGANLKTRLAMETQSRLVEKHEVIFRRYASDKDASEALDTKTVHEDQRTDAGRIVFLHSGRYLLEIRGLGAKPVHGVRAPGLENRPGVAPDAGLVERLTEALADE